MGDDSVSSFSLKMNGDLWLGLEKSGNGEEALARRGLEELRMEGFRPEEVGAVSSDPLYRESVREGYARLSKRFRGWRHSLPGSITLCYTRLGTRTKRGKEEKTG